LPSQRGGEKGEKKGIVRERDLKRRRAIPYLSYVLKKKMGNES